MRNITVVGTGYVGLVSGACLADLGNKVTCIDVDKKKIEGLKKGKAPFYEKDIEGLIKKNLRAKRLSFSDELKQAAKGSQFIFIATGTPTKQKGDRVDLSQVIKVASDLVKIIKEHKIIVIKSTVPIGAYELIIDVFKKGKKKEGRDFDIVFNPEFLREGDAVYDFFNPTRMVFGSNSKSAAKKTADLFKSFNCPVIFTNIATAKMIKYASNTFLASRISFINEIANICEKVGADISDVAKGLGYDKRIGEGYLSAGIGVGGPCLEKDLRGLIQIAQDHGYESNYLKAILEKNEHQIRQIVNKVKTALGGSLYNKKIGILGLSFKAGSNDVRNSLAMRLIEILSDQGAKVKAYDSLSTTEARELLPQITYTKDAYEAAKDSQALVILTDWPEFKELDFKKIKSLMDKPIIIDGRNLYNAKKMTKLGFVYKGVGR